MILNDFINHLDRSVFNQKAYAVKLKDLTWQTFW